MFFPSSSDIGAGYNEGMFFRQLLHEEKSCLSYVIGCPTHRTCVVIDPQGDVERYFAVASRRGLKIDAVIETHIHADHVSIAPELAKQSSAILYYGPRAEIRFAHQELKDSDIITVGNRKITALHTPGHTQEHISLYVDDWLVLTGDSLFVGDVGRVDLSLRDTSHESLQGRAGMLYDSVQRFRALPEWTEIFPGHYAGSVCGKGMDGKPVSTIGRELRRNKPFQLAREQFIEYVLHDTPPVPEDFRSNKRKNMGMSDM